MILIRIDLITVYFSNNISTLEACKFVGINLPKFCYSEGLSIAGNCRMCLVELKKSPKPVVSCAMPIVNNAIFFTNTALLKKARENILETLLINHPLDCPICDQGGECDLQDETKIFGVDNSRFFFDKRGVKDKNFGPVIKTIMTRCIHCTRCVRFGFEIAGNNVFGTINRGSKTEISNYVISPFSSFLSGNVVDLCPVGALRGKTFWGKSFIPLKEDDTKIFGLNKSRLFFDERDGEVDLIDLVFSRYRTRSIHNPAFLDFDSIIVKGKANRGSKTEISEYVFSPIGFFSSDENILELCPVGALTSKDFSFKTRTWDLTLIESRDLSDGLTIPISFNYKEETVIRILPKIKKTNNNNWISDKVRYSFDSLTNFRLTCCFGRQFLTHYRTSWEAAFRHIQDEIYYRAKQAVFIVDDDIDFESLIFLKKLLYYGKKKISVLTLNCKIADNLYLSRPINSSITIKEAAVCFLLFVDLQIENVSLNIALKRKETVGSFHIFNFGNSFTSTYPILFTNISVENLIFFFESKKKIICSLFVQKLTPPLFMIGELFLEKVLSCCNLTLFLTRIVYNTLILFVRLKPNSEGVQFLNYFSTINKKSTENSSTFYLSLNLSDSLFIRKYFDKNKRNVWLNPCGSDISSKYCHILPTLFSIEYVNLFLNLEQEPVYVATLYPNETEAKSLNSFLIKFIKKMSSYMGCYLINLFYFESLYYNHLNYLHETACDPLIFKKSKYKMRDFCFSVIKCNYEQFLINRYPLKSSIEDFFLSDLFSKNSINLNKYSASYEENVDLFLTKACNL